MFDILYFIVFYYYIKTTDNVHLMKYIIFIYIR